ncbi:MAG: DUF1549 and DUF1553 domain-containing protein [Pirellulales bacterium]
MHPALAQRVRNLLLAGLTLAGWLSFAAPAIAEDAAPLAPAIVDAAEATPSFLHDVMPVLSKAGCNLGTCHGNKNGKGGFRLSLRGQTPEDDYTALSREFAGRRINSLSPEQSLILLKPTTAIAHQGGQRFGIDSIEYETLHRWIAGGAPGPQSDAPALVSLSVSPEEEVLVAPQDELRVTATATFTDGTTRDVTRMAVYETSNMLAEVSPEGVVRRLGDGETTVLVRFLETQVPVRLAFIPRRDDFVWSDPPVQNYIDRLVWEKLRRLRIHPSPPADDATFVRRAYLDAIGVLPTADEASRFVEDTSSDKRAKLVDELLARAEFAGAWALKWSDLVRNEEKVLDAKGVDLFYDWMRQSFADGKPLDEFVREMVASRGSTYDNPPANFWRAHRDPFTRAETTAQLFLGVRLQCAKCHNHPFDRWTQDDYYSWSAMFARIDYEVVENDRKDEFDKHEFKGEQIVQVKDEGEVKNARTGKNAEPRLLGAETPPLDEKADRLEPAAEWIANGDNELFARTQANRIWYHVMGRGVVEPVDDFRPTNPPSNPELLDALTEDFIEHDFDVKHLVRTIMTSTVYGLSAQPNETNGGDEANFARAVVRRLTAEQLLDAQCQVLDEAADFNGFDQGTRAGELPGVQRVRPRDKRPSTADRFLTVFGKPQRLLACECERSDETTLSQALLLVGGEGLHERLSADDNRLGRLVHSNLENEQIIDELYWTALARPPSEVERSRCVELLNTSSDRRTALEDITWALLNAKEFIFRH